jgi:hypothetical protein
MTLDHAAIEHLSKLEKAAPHDPVEFFAVTGDAALYTHPGADFRLNSNIAWVQGPKHRSLLKARAEAEFSAALRNAAPQLLALAKEALAAREWQKCAYYSDVEGARAAHAVYASLVSAHTTGGAK